MELPAQTGGTDVPQGKGRGRGRGRGRGKGRGRGRRKQSQTDADPDAAATATGDLAAATSVSCAKRMAALLHACANSVGHVLLADSQSVYTFSLASSKPFDENEDAPLLESVWSTSGLICSRHYSRRMWAVGEIVNEDGQRFFKLRVPLEFQQTDELMESIYHAFNESKDCSRLLCRVPCRANVHDGN